MKYFSLSEILVSILVFILFAFITSIDIDKKENESSIGVLNYNSKAYILDSEGRRVPHGAVGELYLTGYQIADGYINRDEETEKAFLKNP